MEKLPFIPEQDGYTVTPGDEALRVQLQGGKGRYRKDVEGASATVTVTFSLKPREYKAVALFFRGVVSSGTVPFLMDLILFDADLTEHTCFFLPGTFQLSGIEGHNYTTVATLEVIPNPAPDALEAGGIFAIEIASAGDPHGWLADLKVIGNDRFING